MICRKSLTHLNETFGEGLQEPQVVVHDGIDPEAISDGFRWRKYGQKVVKGNPYPRSNTNLASDMSFFKGGKKGGTNGLGNGSKEVNS